MRQWRWKITCAAATTCSQINNIKNIFLKKKERKFFKRTQTERWSTWRYSQHWTRTWLVLWFWAEAEGCGPFADMALDAKLEHRNAWTAQGMLVISLSSGAGTSSSKAVAMWWAPDPTSLGLHCRDPWNSHLRAEQTPDPKRPSVCKEHWGWPGFLDTLILFWFDDFRNGRSQVKKSDSFSGRERQILYISYMWNLKK